MTLLAPPGRRARSRGTVARPVDPVAADADCREPGRPGRATFAGVDERLLLAVADRDEVAFRGLYDRLAPLVYGLAVRTLRDEHFAQEVVQEVFLEVWRRADRFDPARASARTFVLLMAHRRGVDRVRREQSSRDRALADARRNPSSVASHEDDSVDFLHLNHERAAVRAALAVLSDLQREAIELAYFQGFTYVEVAAFLDAPLGTVKSRIRDGLLRLRAELGGRP